VPKSLHFYVTPAYTIKKDATNAFEMESRESRKNPGPGTYSLRPVMTKEEEEKLIKKRREKVDPSKLPKRPMFMDDDLRRAKGVPAPG
jgi:hypothetical protein